VTYGIGTACSVRLFDLESILPLGEIGLGDVLYWAPANPHAYLARLYGEDYLQLPDVPERTGHFEDYRSS